MSVAGIFPDWYQSDPQNWAQAISKSLKVINTLSVPDPRKGLGMSVPSGARVCVNLGIIRKARNIIVDINESTSGVAWKRVCQGFDGEHGEENPIAEGRSHRAQSVPPTAAEMLRVATPRARSHSNAA